MSQSNENPMVNFGAKTLLAGGGKVAIGYILLEVSYFLLRAGITVTVVSVLTILIGLILQHRGHQVGGVVVPIAVKFLIGGLAAIVAGFIGIEIAQVLIPFGFFTALVGGGLVALGAHNGQQKLKKPEN